VSSCSSKFLARIMCFYDVVESIRCTVLNGFTIRIHCCEAVFACVVVCCVWLDGLPVMECERYICGAVTCYGY
jgi:hypothetical protein